jgi:hypothetical protein
LKVGEEVFFEQGGGANCIWTYEEKEIGAKVLIYTSPDENGRRVVVECGRSSGLKGAVDDLLYLENLDKVRGKTRMSGTIKYDFWGSVPVGQKLEAKIIRIIGRNKTYTAKTNKDGVYEIYDLPPGNYQIEPEIPVGWKINPGMLEYSPSLPRYYSYSKDIGKNRFPVTLEKGKHVSLDFYYDIDNYIRGRVVDPSGKPMKGICVTAVSADDTNFDRGPFRCTNEKGVFTIEELRRKSYVLVINGDGKLSATEPIEMLFYPGVKERSKAMVVNINEGKKVNLQDFRVPEVLETIVLEGVLSYSDGKIITGHEKAQFVADNDVQTREREPYDYSDDFGIFSIKIFKGQSGKIRAEKIFSQRHLEKCPEIKKAIVEENIGGSVTAASPWVEIKGNRDFKDIKLIFPFAECKIPER